MHDAARQDRDGGDVEERGCGADRLSRVAREAVVAADPGEEAFHNPSTFLDQDVDLIGSFAHDLNSNSGAFTYTLARTWALLADSTSPTAQFHNGNSALRADRSRRAACRALVAVRPEPARCRAPLRSIAAFAALPRFRLKPAASQGRSPAMVPVPAPVPAGRTRGTRKAAAEAALVMKSKKDTTMAGSLNRTTLMGNLGRDPEIRTTQLGSRVATFSVATTDSWTDKNSGEKREHTEWHQIVVWNEALIDHVIEPHVHKGDRIYLEGSNRTRKWTDDQGTERYRTEVTVGRFDGKIVLLGRNGNGRPDPTPPNAPGYGAAGSSGGSGQAGGADLDDEVPF